MQNPSFTLDYKASPTAAAFHRANSFFRGLRGPVGSGKSVACLIEIFHRACRQRPGRLGIRKTRFAVVRNSYPELKSTTLKSWQDWFPDEICPIKTNESPITGRLCLPLQDNTSIDMEILFIALDKPKDIAKLLSLELTGAFVNETKEVQKEVLDTLTSRVGRFPSMRDGGPTWSGVWADTNAPSDLHFWAELEKSPPRGWKFFVQPSALIEDDSASLGYKPNRRAENIANLPNGHQYYLNLISGKDPNWIRAYVLNNFAATMAGKAVYGAEWNEQIHVNRLPLIPIKGHEVVVGLDFGLCYDDQTEVLTAQGWKYFSQVDPAKDRVATLNPHGYRVEYTDINFKVDRPYEGELLHFKSQNFDFMVTPEHRTPFTHRDTPYALHWAAAQELEAGQTSHRFIQLQGFWDGQPLNMLGLPDEQAAAFLGWYLSEGSVENRKGNNFRVSIAQRKPCPELDALMRNSPWWEGTVWVKNKFGWRSCVPPNIGRRLKAFGNSWNKCLPAELKQATRSVLRTFLNAYILGDGHVRTKTKKDSGVGKKVRNEITIATVSERMKDDLQEIIMKAGFCSSVRVQKARESYMACEDREIQCPDIFIVTIKRFPRAEILPGHVKRVPYSGRIYCLNVPYHTLYVRRKGRPCWNGNTPAAVFTQMVDGRLRVINELTAKRMGLEQFLISDVLQLIGQKYYDYDIFFSGDPSGMKGSDTDERTCFQVLAKLGLRAAPAFANNLEARLGSVRGFLTRLVGGKPAMLVSPTCRGLINGFDGEYMYAKLQLSGETRYRDKPEKNQASHCLAAGTMVSTPTGFTPIEDLVVGDLVSTPFGPRQVTATMSRSNDDLWRVGPVVCTSDHPFPTAAGVRLPEQLQYADVLYAEKHQCQQSIRSRSSTGYASISSGRGTTKRATRRWAGALSTCTATCGSIFMGARRLLATMSTTATRTARTTAFRILSCFPAPVTNGIISGSGSNGTQSLFNGLSPLPGQLPLSGTPRKKDAPGTRNTANGPGKEESFSLTSAPIVESLLSDFAALTRKGSAAQRVSRRHGGPAVSMTRTEAARYVEILSALTATQRLRPVPVTAGASRYPGRSAVYDLTVEGAHCFYANGLLTLNCHDALQYACMRWDIMLRRQDYAAEVFMPPAATADAHCGY